jgi:hypothetical protein
MYIIQYYKLYYLIMIVSEANKYHAERKQSAQKIQARNCLERYAYNLCNVAQVNFA